MSDIDRDAVSARAYAIWEEEGRPEGKALAHWARASKELYDADAEESASAVQPLDPPGDPIERTDGPDKVPLYP